MTEIDNREIKRDAKTVLRLSKPSPVLAALIFLAVAFVFTLLDMRLNGYLNTEALLKIGEYMQNGDMQRALQLASANQPNTFQSIVSTAIGFAQSVLHAGFVLFILNSVRGAAPSVYNLLDGFGQFFRIIILSLLQSLIISIGLAILIVPGIIAAYCYRYSLYILLDHPDMPVIQCMGLSRTLVQGHKMEMFLLDLSFIGHILLSVVFLPASVYVIPYLYTSWALFYERLNGVSFDESRLSKVAGEDNSLPPSGPEE